MSNHLGPIAFEKIQQQFLEGMTNPRRPVSPKLTEEIDQEVKRIVDRAHEIALGILKQNRQLLEDMAQKLLQKEVLEGTNLGDLLALAQTPQDVDSWLQTGE